MMIAIYILGYILIGIVILTLLCLLGAFTKDDATDMPPLAMVIAWPLVLGITALAIPCYAAEISHKGLHKAGCWWVDKCQRKTKVEEKVQS